MKIRVIRGLKGYICRKKVIYQNQSFRIQMHFKKRASYFLFVFPTKNIYLDTSRQIDHQFQILFNHKTASEILFKNENIGNIWCGGIEITCGYFAGEYGELGSNLGYPKGIKIWNQYTRDWTTIDIPWISTIIGWKRDTN